MRYLLQLGFLLFFVATQAQNPKIDSLKKALAQAQDTSRLHILNELSREYYLAYDYPGSTQSAQQVLADIQKLSPARQTTPGALRAQARAYHNLGSASADQGDLVAARQCYGRALKGYMDLRDFRGAATSLYSLARVNEAMGQYEKALKEYRIVLKLREDQHDKNNIATTRLSIGNAMRQEGKVPEALAEYLTALKIYEETKDLQGIAGCHNNIAIIYETQENYPEALKEYIKVVSTLNQAQDKVGVAVFQHNLGTLYVRMGNRAAALKEYESSLKVGEETNIPSLVANNLCNIADLMFLGGKYDEAREKYAASLKMCTQIGDQDGVATARLGLGEVYLKEGKVGDAKRELAAALGVAQVTGNKDNLKKGYEILARADSAAGDAKTSLLDYQKYIAYRDSLNNEENTKKTVRSQMQYEFDKKEEATHLDQERKDALAEADKKRQNIILIAISGFGLLVLGFAIFAYRSFLQKKKANIEISRQKEIIEEKQQEILDSIYYARRIQQSLLPRDVYVQKSLKRLIKNN